MEQKDLLSSLPGQNVQQNLPNATTVLVLGIISIIGAFCYGIVGLICGVIGLVLANKDRRLFRESPDFYSQASYGTSNAGRICSIIGLIISVLIILLVVVVLVFFGLTSTQFFN